MSLTFAAAVRRNKPKRNAEEIFGGYGFSISLQKNGRAWGWGNNGYGRIGDNSTTSRITPVSVAGAVKTFCNIHTKYAHCAAIDKNGRAWGWGYNDAGGIGDNSTTSRLTPVSVLGAAKTFCKIATGLYTTHAIDKNGRLWGWGGGFYGAVGDNSVTNRLTPVSVLGAVKTFCEIAASRWYHTLGIDKNGRAWGWGYNLNGQLGDNSTTSRRTPVSIAGAVKTFCKISGGFFFTNAIDKNGRAWGWGYNPGGQLGDGTTTSRRTPVSVAGAVKTFCKISAGDYHCIAIDKNGRAWGWGYNFNGALGDNSTTNRCTPVSVAGAVKTFCKISAGSVHSVAIDKNGRAWGWGANYAGQLGNNSIISSLTPVRICNI